MNIITSGMIPGLSYRFKFVFLALWLYCPLFGLAAQDCPDLILSQSKNVFSGFVKVRKDQSLFVKIERPSVKPKAWHLLIHGLLDNHHGYDLIAEKLLQAGHGVVRVDLRGFGESLNHEAAPAIVHYHEYLIDLLNLLKVLDQRFEIKKPFLTGHSLGGGLVLALLSQENILNWVNPRAVVIAPYVYRLDATIWNKFVPPFFRAGSDFITDTFILDPIMRKVFGDFFDEISEQRGADINSPEWRKIKNNQVSHAIATVKGLRELNSLDSVDHISKNIELTLIYGDDDPLFDTSYTQDLSELISARENQVIELDGGHMLLTEAPDVVAEVILKANLK